MAAECTDTLTTINYYVPGIEKRESAMELFREE
jgi:hypothetical protein